MAYFQPNKEGGQAQFIILTQSATNSPKYRYLKTSKEISST